MRGQSTRQRWKECESIAEQLLSEVQLIIPNITLGILKQRIYSKLWPQLKEWGEIALGNACHNIKVVLDRIKGSLIWEDLIAPLPLLEESDGEVIQDKLLDKELRNKRKFDKNKDEEITPANELKMAFWFINKIGKPERAMQVLKAAITALNEVN